MKLSENDKGYDQKSNICMLSLLPRLRPQLLLQILLLTPRYSIYNIGGIVELNQKTLCACTLLKECISRIDLGINTTITATFTTAIITTTATATTTATTITTSTTILLQLHVRLRALLENFKKYMNIQIIKRKYQQCHSNG